MDLSASIIPKSDQLNADEMVAGPATYTIREVIKGSVEQPFDFLLVETDRAYRPSKTMRRVIVNAWGPEAANYAGRRLTLYREPTIKFGGQTVGGIRISHMSHIEGPVEVMAQTTRGKRETFTVQPLALESASPGSNGAPESSAQGVSTDVVPDPAQTGTPSIPQGGLKDALTALSAHQRAELFTECGIPEKASMGVIRAKLHEKWVALELPQREAGFEPVPVTLLGAIYQARANGGSSEAFQQYLDTGSAPEPGEQAAIA